MKRTISKVLLASFFLGRVLLASPIRISLLDNEETIKQTTDFLSAEHDLLTWFNGAIKPTTATDNSFFAASNNKKIEDCEPISR